MNEERSRDLRLGDAVVARYVDGSGVESTLGPRPYLHPVTTLGGTTVTDAFPEDHRWHLGVSVAMQDVARTNLWGGRTYGRDAGYTWLDDHGRIVHDAWLTGPAAGFAERLLWQDPSGATLVTEERVVTGRELPGTTSAWVLGIDYTLTAPDDRDVALGSPATNGRPGGAGYGGFFWRAPLGPSETFTAGLDGEEKVNGSTEPWLAFTGGSGAAAYTLIFSGLAEGDHWFVRTGIYPGVCVALAWERPLVLVAGQSVRRRHRVLVADGVLRRDDVAPLINELG